MKKIIRLTESDLTRIVKRVINEEMNFGDKNTWSQIEKNLIGFNSPKVIRWKDPDTGEPFTSLNWGSHKERGHNWGVSIVSYESNLAFTTTDDINAKIFKNVMGCNLDKGSKSWSTNASCKLDYSNPTEVVSVVKNLVSSLE